MVTTSAVDHVLLTVDDGGDDNRDKYGYYKCRGPCSLVFATNATRKRLSLLHL